MSQGEEWAGWQALPQWDQARQGGSTARAIFSSVLHLVMKSVSDTQGCVLFEHGAPALDDPFLPAGQPSTPQYVIIL